LSQHGFSFALKFKNSIKMNKTTVIEMVLFRTNEGIKPEEAKTELMKLNDFLVKQEGFISRKTAVADDGQYLDIVYWTDLNSAKSASDKAMQDTETAKVFSIIEQKTMLFKHFEIFNNTL
jgi:hypothetical protein